MEALDVHTEILNQLAALNAKLDRIDARVEQIARRQRALEDLIDEFGPLAKEVYQTLLEELCCVQDDFDLDDVAELARKLLRNTRRFSDATPLGKDVFVTVVEKLDELERMGAFDFAREALHIAEHVMEEFTPEDAQQLAHAITDILKTTRSLTQPDVLRMVNTSLEVVRDEQPEPMGVWEMIKALNDPQLRQGLSLSIAMVKQFPAALGQADAKPLTDPT
jgi:uncharacterized protein YjgD (DUF1641 family)